MKINELKLKPAQLRRICDPKTISIDPESQITFKDMTIGQKRAMKSLNFGLGLKVKGYNVFVLGEPGSGKTTTIRKVLSERALKMATPPDICYIYNFSMPEQPIPIMIPPGMGVVFARDIDRLIEMLQQDISKILTSKAFTEKKSEIVNKYHNKAEKLLTRFAKEARKKGLDLKQKGEQLIFPPLIDGEIITEQEFEALPEEKRKDIESTIRSFRERLSEYERLHRKFEKELEEEIIKAERNAIRVIISEEICELRNKFEKVSKDICDYLILLEQHILEHHRRFLIAEEEESHGKEEEREDEVNFCASKEPHRFVEYKINVLVDRTHEKGAPLIIERNPNYSNLLGYMEYRELRGALKTDHTLLRAGALHKAWGGYLILQINDLMRHPSAWEALKRALREKELKIEEFEEEERPKTTGTLRPKPLPLDLKVILIGNPDSYYLLYNNDEDFVRLFKAKVDYEDRMAWNNYNINKLCMFLLTSAKESGNLLPDTTALARIIEEAARICENKNMLTTKLSLLLDLVGEADYWARFTNGKIITSSDVNKALQEKFHRNGKVEDLILRLIKEGSILLDTDGQVVGQVNGIFVYDLGDHAFGIPMRITARTYVGKKGLVNIEREVQLSGAIHDKGSLITIGYLGGRYAQNQPLCFSASITFEQSYEEVEGDSASCAELFALLSSLADIPIKQGIAVTGSVNQNGEIQPIGSINEKIEGVYKICSMKGLTGNEGVIIPKINIDNLMLSEDVIEAVKNKKFNIWGINNVDEGMEILTGIKPGKKLSDGSWEKDTINHFIDKKLSDYADRVKKNDDNNL